MAFAAFRQHIACINFQRRRVESIIGIVKSGLVLRRTKEQILRDIEDLDEYWKRQIAEAGCEIYQLVNYDSQVERIKNQVRHAIL